MKRMFDDGLKLLEGLEPGCLMDNVEPGFVLGLEGRVSRVLESS